MPMATAPWQQPAIIRHSQNLIQSFQQWTGESLLPLQNTSPQNIAHKLFIAPFVLLSHGMEADPVLNYGNQTALELWEMTWTELTQMPSRCTAEPNARAERGRLLSQASQQGYLEGYRGVRVTKSGRRFLIEDALIWDILDRNSHKCGQAAKFSQWQWL